MPARAVSVLTCPRRAGTLLALVAAFHVTTQLPGVRPGGFSLWFDVGLANLGPLLAVAVLAARAWSTAEDRLGWTLLAAGFGLWTAGSLLYGIVTVAGGTLPEVSVADALFLALYPFAVAGIVALTRVRQGRVPRAMLLDGLICGATAIAVGAVTIRPYLDAGGVPLVELVVNLAYPFGDIGLIALTVGVLATLGVRGRPELVVLCAGLIAFGIGDGAWLALVAGGEPPLTSVFYLGWPLGLLLVAAASLVPPAHAAARPGQALGAVASLLAGVVSIALLLTNQLTSRPVGVAFAALSLGLVFLRLLLAQRDVLSAAVSRVEARTDDLTGLPNRRAFQQVLDAATAAGPPAVLLLDLDGFKELNDTLGHDAGDALLVEVGRRLGSALGPADHLARLGGDEFAAVLATGTSEAAAEAAGRVLRRALAEPLALAGTPVHVDASVGVAVAPRGTAAGDVLRRADVAMYAAKRRRSGVELYRAGVDGHSRDRLELLGALRQGIDEDALVLHFQPIVAMRDGRVEHVEALVRWQHPQHGLLFPDRFLDLAEQTSLVHPLTHFVLDRAIGRCARLREEPATAGVGVAVNVTAASLMDAELPGLIAWLLERHGLPGSALTIELTERAVVDDVAVTAEYLHALRALGARIALDDFGTGHSSLALIERLPLDALKIDRTFVDGIETDPRRRAIVASTIALAHGLELEVVAEGVETEAAWAMLAAHGCDTAQGWLVARALPAEELGAWLAGWHGRPVVAGPSRS